MASLGVAAPYFLTFEHRPHYLFARVTGEHDSYLISTLYWGEILREVRRTCTRKLLVYEELRSNASRADAFQYVCSFRKEDFAGIQIAFVDRYPDHSVVNDFTLQAAQNKGFHLQNFSTIGDAERWLVPFDRAA
jgi:hypothetical protein